MVLCGIPAFVAATHARGASTKVCRTGSGVILVVCAARGRTLTQVSAGAKARPSRAAGRGAG